MIEASGFLPAATRAAGDFDAVREGVANQMQQRVSFRRSTRIFVDFGELAFEGQPGLFLPCFAGEIADGKRHCGKRFRPPARAAPG